MGPSATGDAHEVSLRWVQSVPCLSGTRYYLMLHFGQGAVIVHRGYRNIDELADHERYNYARGWDVVSRLIYWIAGRTRGQGMVEYALIFALIVVVVLGTLILFGPQMSSIYKDIENAI